MDEYIEKRKVVNLLIELEKEFQQFKPLNGFEHAMYRKLCEAKIAIEKLPAADVVPVLRCKDCRHFKNYGKTSLLIDGKNIKAGWCHRRARFDEEYRMPPDGFCSYGERKTSADG